MNAACSLYDTVGAVEAAIGRGRRRLTWLVEDVRGVWSAMTAIPWTATDAPEPPAWVNDGYVPPGLERVLPDPPLEQRHPSCAPTEEPISVAYLNRMLGHDGGDAA